MSREGWMRIETWDGKQHVLRADEYRTFLHSVKRCKCNPRIVKGVVVHRTLDTERLYTPLKGRGN